MYSRVMGIALLMVLLVVASVRAQDGIGIGFILGEPTGLTIKKWVSNEHAIDAAAAWSFSENDSFQFHADYLIHDFGLLKVGGIGGRLPVYYGVGGRIKLENHDNDNSRNNDDTLLGVRVPFGISYLPARAPFEFFAEVVPVLDLVPDTEFDMNGAIGMRFYFQ